MHIYFKLNQILNFNPGTRLARSVVLIFILLPWILDSVETKENNQVRNGQPQQLSFYDLWIESREINLISWIQLILKNYVSMYSVINFS